MLNLCCLKLELLVRVGLCVAVLAMILFETAVEFSIVVSVALDVTVVVVVPIISSAFDLTRFIVVAILVGRFIINSCRCALERSDCRILSVKTSHVVLSVH